MKAKILKVTKNASDFQYPQIDVEVEYIDKDFPADHQYTDGGKRLFVFTLPHEKFEALTQAELEGMIAQQGKEFNKVLRQSKDMVNKETNLKELEGKEITI